MRATGSSSFQVWLAEVTEELQREEELLELELWEMEREERDCFIKLMIMMIGKNCNNN